jgi:endonuclease/exonuclease/phosphatase (EEP) superfamily protein YafD
MSEAEQETGPLSRDAQQPRTLVGSTMWLLRYLVVLVPILLLVASLLGQQFWVCELICNFRAYILGALLFTGPLLFLLKRKLLSVAWVFATFWAMIGTASIYLPASQPTAPTEGAQTVKLMSFNVLGDNPHHDEVIAEITKHDPDILVVVEYANLWHEALQRLNATYPHRHEQPRWHGFGVAIFSKLPIVDKEVMHTAGSRYDFPLVLATVRIGDRELRIAGAHLLSPRDPNRLRIRNLQMQEIGQYLSADNLPTVVVGDFNCVPWSPFLSDFLNRTGYRDSRQGFGYHATWHAKRPLFRVPIDHAFVSPEIYVHNRKVGQYAGSDHYPVIVELSVQ